MFVVLKATIGKRVSLFSEGIHENRCVVGWESWFNGDLLAGSQNLSGRCCCHLFTYLMSLLSQSAISQASEVDSGKIPV